VLEALGVGLDPDPQDVCVRCNFVTLAADGTIADRRAGRIDSDEGRRLVALLADSIDTIDGVSVTLAPIKEYRFALVLKGEGLGASIPDTDPQETGRAPLAPVAEDAASVRTVKVLQAFVEQAQHVLAEEPRANGVTLRGIGKRPKLPTLFDLYGLRASVVAHYPMYRGVARLVGMQVIDVSGEGEALPEKMDAVRNRWGEDDLVFLHVKKTDSAGEDGDQAAKAEQIEAFDRRLPELLTLAPPVVAITGDHATPARMRSHSWHPVPALLHGPHVMGGEATRFDEFACRNGELGRMRGHYLLGEMLAQAGRLQKFGA